MRLILFTVLAATVAGLLAGGTLRDFPVIPLGDPFDQAISVGDVCVQLGAAWFIVFSMPRRRPRIVETEVAT